MRARVRRGHRRIRAALHVRRARPANHRSQDRTHGHHARVPGGRAQPARGANRRARRTQRIEEQGRR